MGQLSPQTIGHLSMLLFSALVAGSFSLGGMAANEIAPAALNAVRFALGAGIMTGIGLATTGLPRAAFAAPWRYVVLGGLFASYFVMMFEGLKTASPVSAAAVFTLTPIMTAAFGWLILRQVTTPRLALGLSIGAIGAVWVIFRADWQLLRAFQVGTGEFIYFWGCMAHAIYIPLLRKLNRGEPAVVFTLGILVAGCIVLIAYGWRDILATDWMALPGIVWITLAYITIFATTATFLLLQVATLRLPAAKVMAYTYLTPSWVICWEIALGQGAPPLRILFGVVFTVIALLLLLKDDSRPA